MRITSAQCSQEEIQVSCSDYRGTSLIWRHETIYRGRAFSTVLDLRSSRHQTLAREFGRSWGDLAETAGYAASTTRRISYVIKDFLRHVGEVELSPRASMADDGTELVEALHSWELGLRRRYRTSSDLPSRDSNQLSLVMRWHRRSGGKVSTIVRAWVEAPSMTRPAQPVPVDEVSNRSRLSLRNACRQVVRDAEARVQQHSDAVASISQEHAGTPRMEVATDSDGLRPRGTRNDSAIGSPVEELVDQFKVAQGLSLTSPELQAFRILILMETGWAPEQLTDLRISDLIWNQEKLDIRSEKRRANKVLNYEYFSGSSNWNVYSLFSRLLALTDPLRKMSTIPEIREYLFVKVTRRFPGNYVVTETFRGYLLKQFVQDYGVEWTGTYDIRRLRKTFKSLQSAFTGTASGAAGLDHTVQVSRDHYMQTTTVHILAAKATNAAQRLVYESLSKGPSVTARPAPEVAQNHKDPDTRLAAENTANESRRDVEMGVTACKDPYDSPFSARGTLCHVRPSMCFLCPNALIFQDHIPRIMAFRRTILSQRPSYPPLEFHSMWGQTLAAMESILGEFSPAQIEAAESPQQTLDKVHVPISQRVRFE